MMRLGVMMVVFFFAHTVLLTEGRSASGRKYCTTNKDCSPDKICLNSDTINFDPYARFCIDHTPNCDTINTLVQMELQPGPDVYIYVRPSVSSNKCSEGNITGLVEGKIVCCAEPNTGVIFENAEKPDPSYTPYGDYKLCSSDGSGCDANIEYCARLINSANQSTYACFKNHVDFNNKIKIEGILKSCNTGEDCQYKEFCFERLLKNGSGICATTVVPYAYTSVIGKNHNCATDPFINQLALKSGKRTDFFESFMIAETATTRVCVIRELMEEVCGRAALPVKNKDDQFMTCADENEMALCEKRVQKTESEHHRTFCGMYSKCCKSDVCPDTLFPFGEECGIRGKHCTRYGWCVAGRCCPHYPLQGTFCSTAKAEEVKYSLPVWTFNLPDGSLCSLGHYTWYQEKFELRDTCSRELTCPEEDEVCVKTHAVPAYGGHYYMCMVTPLINRSRIAEDKAEQSKTDMILLSISFVTFAAIISGLLWIALH